MKRCVGLLIITVLLYILGLLTQQAPVLVKYPQWGLAKDHPWWKLVNQTAQTHFPQRDCLVCAGPRVPTKTTPGEPCTL